MPIITNARAKCKLYLLQLSRNNKLVMPTVFFFFERKHAYIRLTQTRYNRYTSFEKIKGSSN